MVREFLDLRGAVFCNNDNNYYLLTTNSGVYRGPDLPTLSNAGPLAGSEGYHNFNGLIAVGASVIAVSNVGYLWVQPPAGDSYLTYTWGTGYTGALALWGPSGPPPSGNPFGPPTPTRLLLGTISGDGSYGYREMALEASGELGGLVPFSPGLVSGGSVFNNPQYESSLGRRVVNGIIQAPDMTIFASTQTDGLWSYRLGVWNAEE
jgi:hypothetical protein